MSAVRRATVAALVVVAACQGPAPVPDGGKDFDAGNPDPRPSCSGGCASNQVCDTVRRICVDGCGGCDGGVCVGTDAGFTCQSLAITCNGVTCAAGETACVAGSCRCVVAANGTQDSCRVAGRWCDGTSCRDPVRYEQCTPGLARCPAGFVCDPLFGANQAVCVRDCSAPSATCDRGELCAELVRSTGCLAQGLFVDQECRQHVPAGDGGLLTTDAGTLVTRTVPVSNTCLLRSSMGAVVDTPGTGTGNCTYAVFKLYEEGISPRRTCQPPGTAGLGQRCRRDYSPSTTATQCGTGLECFLSQGTEGVCLPMCNAVSPVGGFVPQPACGEGEACVNLFRYSDPSLNAVVGVCMRACDVFDPARSACAPVGGTETSCVPTTPGGDLLVSPSGEGICVPRRVEVKAGGEPCAETDPFKGAACVSGHLCTSTTELAAPTCIAICDLECAGADGGTPPPRCTGKTNVTCAGGARCTQVTSTTGATVGYCL